jgi:hypothetical protein
VAAKLGLDYEDLLIEIKAAQDMRKTMGVELQSIATQQAQQAQQGPAGPN